MDLVEYTIKLIGLSLGTLFWAWYLVYEYEVAKGIRKPHRWLGKKLW